MSRLEPVLVGLFFACWTAALLDAVSLLSFAGSLRLSLYGLYGIGALAGWLSGNLYVHRSGGLPGWLRRRLLLVYFIGPLGIVYLLRAMAPAGEQAAAPMVPVYAAGVFTVLFLVPVVLRPRRPRPPRIGG